MKSQINYRIVVDSQKKRVISEDFRIEIGPERKKNGGT